MVSFKKTEFIIMRFKSITFTDFAQAVLLGLRTKITMRWLVTLF